MGANCNQSAIANLLSYAFCKSPDLLWLIDKTIKIVRFWDVSNANNSGGLNNAKILTKSLQRFGTGSNAKVHSFIR